MIKSAAEMKYPTEDQTSHYRYLYEPDGKHYHVHPDAIVQTTVRDLENQYDIGHQTGYNTGHQTGYNDGVKTATLASETVGYQRAEKNFGVRIRNLPTKNQVEHLQKKISKQTFVLGLGLTTAVVAALNSLLNPIENILKLRDGLCYASEDHPAKDAHDVESCKRDGYFAIAGLSLVAVLASITVGTACYNTFRRSRKQAAPKDWEDLLMKDSSEKPASQPIQSSPRRSAGQPMQSSPRRSAGQPMQEAPQEQRTSTVLQDLRSEAPSSSTVHRMTWPDDHSIEHLMSMSIHDDQ